MGRADNFLAAKAMHPTVGRIDLNDATSRLTDHHAITGCLKDTPILGFLLAQKRDSCRVVRDIATSAPNAEEGQAEAVDAFEQIQEGRLIRGGSAQKRATRWVWKEGPISETAGPFLIQLLGNPNRE
jgi:hypothetical protein